LKKKVLVITGGHPFEKDPFFEIFNSFENVDWFHEKHPKALSSLNPEKCDDIDAIVFYDIPGIELKRNTDSPVEVSDPTSEYKENFELLLKAGQGLVFLHHAIAGWPSWERYADVIGGRFHYQPGSLHGVNYPDSGYRFDTTQEIRVVDPDHPICEGIPESFTITDEAYICPIFEDSITPVLRSNFDFKDSSNFYSSSLAMKGEMNSNEIWEHPKGSDLIAWVRHESLSPITYIQLGDGPVAYADTNFRKLLSNSINWVSSKEAKNWVMSEKLNQITDQAD